MHPSTFPIGPGTVHFFDLTQHTGISKNTIKSRHYVAVVMNARLLSRNGHNTVVCVPMTSFQPEHWNNTTGKTRLFYHHLLEAQRYPDLDHDTIVKCEQVFTINREYFNGNYKFSLQKGDLSEIRKKIAGVIGVGGV